MRARYAMALLCVAPGVSTAQTAIRQTEVTEVMCAPASTRQAGVVARSSGPPAPVTVASVNPLVGRPGTTVVVNGSGLSAVTGVPIAASWSLKCDTQLVFTMPGSTSETASSLSFTTHLQTPSGNIALPAMQSLLPPKPKTLEPTRLINGESVVVVEPGQDLQVNGFGMSEPPNIVPTVTLNSVQIPLTSTYVLQLRGPVPAAATSGLVTVTTGGGSVTMPQYVTVVSGPTTVDAIDPAVAVPGDVVTIRGLNLFRLYGVCKGSAPGPQIINAAKSGYPWTNTSASFTVPATWSGKVPVWMWTNVNGQIICLASPVSLEVKG